MARPRSFDPQIILQAIKLIFWEKGFEGTSTRDIVAATGLGWQSLYRVFGDKRHMYLCALEDYGEKELVKFVPMVGSGASARTGFLNFLTGILDRGDRRGCFLCNAAVDQAQINLETGKRVKSLMSTLEQAFAHSLMKHAEYERDSHMRKLASAHMLATYCGLQTLMKADMPRKTLHCAVVASTAELLDH